MRHTKIISTLIALSGFAIPLAAQTPVQTPTQTPAAQEPGKVANVVAIVGDSVITSAFLYDAIGQRINQLKADSLPLPQTAAELADLQNTLINERIEELVVLQAIARDTSFKINDVTLASAVEDQYNKVQGQVGGPVAFAQALRQSGMTAQEYRTMLSGQIRTKELFRQFQDRAKEKRQAPKATEKEIEAKFPEWVTAHGAKPAMVSFQQVVIPVQPSDTALARAKAKADSIYQIVSKNRDAFADLARRFSDDAGTKQKGGEFDWFSQDDVVKAFGKAAFSAPVGTILPPVRSEFGYHVIEVQRRRGTQAQARHILISPTITADDIARAQARADSAAALLRSGTDIHEVIKRFGDATAEFSFAAIDPAQVAARTGVDMRGARKNDIVGPASSPAGPGQIFTIAHITDISLGGAWTINDVGVRDNIRAVIESQKLLDEVVAELKRNTYIEIRPH